jgi:hypothetical protein
MSEVVVTGLGPLLANCADRRTLWADLCEGPSQLSFELAPGGDDGIGGHSTATLVGAVGAA